MAKTGNAEQEGTAEGAVLGRATHSLYAKPPVFDDFWAVELLSEATQAMVRDPERYERELAAGDRAMSRVSAIGMGCLRFADDQVEAAAARGVGQYVVLGAGLDTFALRRDDLAGQVRVFEVDHPDVQRLKRARIDAAKRTPAAVPVFVPVDFEVTSMGPELQASSFDPGQPAVFSWLNTLPYLTEEATAATLREIAECSAAGSRLVLNYAPEVAFTEDQLSFLKELMATVEQRGEPFRSRWKPERFTQLLADNGFRLLEELDEQALTERYFVNRSDGMAPGLPLRLVVAESE